jgi:hypothetical protein
MHGPGGGPNSERFAECPGAFARDADIFGLVSELAPLHPRNNTFPGEVFLHLAADALDWCGASRSGPLALEGLRERFLPECTFRGRAKQEVPVCSAGRCGTPWRSEPDLLDEVAWWQSDDFWQYGLFAAVGYIRAAASRARVPVRQACRTWLGALATQRSNGQFRRLWKRSSDGGAADHNGYACASSARGGSGASWAQRIAGGVTAPPLPAAVPAG